MRPSTFSKISRWLLPQAAWSQTVVALAVVIYLVQQAIFAVYPFYGEVWYEVGKEKTQIETLFLSLAILAYVVIRMRQSHPWLNQEYFKWLFHSPWQPGDSLPFGSCLPTWRDIYVVVTVGVIGCFVTGKHRSILCRWIMCRHDMVGHGCVFGEMHRLVAGLLWCGFPDTFLLLRSFSFGVATLLFSICYGASRLGVGSLVLPLPLEL